MAEKAWSFGVESGWGETERKDLGVVLARMRKRR